MARFNPTRFPPGFFDLPADAGQALPLEIVSAWTRSDQSQDSARRILAPHTLTGYVVATDAAGLTRLSAERSLIEILALVSRPKELVHGYGTAVGGRALGVWAADNTAMFYADEVPASRVLGMLLTLFDAIAAECEVGIGGCLHVGEFFLLGNGLYGADADRVEAVAEDHTVAGELLITDKTRDRLLAEPNSSSTDRRSPTATSGTPTADRRAPIADRLTGEFTLAPRSDLRPRFGEIFRVTDGPRLTGLTPSDTRYPLPFTEEFFGGLHEFQRTRRTSVVPRPAYRDSAVVVLAHEREDRDIPELAALNDLALAAGVKRLGTELADDLDGAELKTTVGTSIYHFKAAAPALRFSEALRDRLRAQGVELAIGIDVGRVLVFELGPGLRDVAGSPVNIASKLAQDAGVFGTVQLSAAAAVAAGVPASAPRRAVTVGGVTLEVVAR